MEPLVMLSGEYSASLDGVTLRGDLIVEIKCPYRGKTSTLWQDAAAGAIPTYCYWQLQHQLLVTEAELAHLYIFGGSDGILLEQRPEPERWDTIRCGWDEFQRYLVKDLPPPFTERDAVERDDPEWRAAAQKFLVARRSADQATVDLEAAKAALIALTRHPNEKGCGVGVVRYWKAGNVDFRNVPELQGVNLDDYRLRGREEIRVSTMRDR